MGLLHRHGAPRCHAHAQQDSHSSHYSTHLPFFVCGRGTTWPVTYQSPSTCAVASLQAPLWPWPLIGFQLPSTPGPALSAPTLPSSCYGSKDVQSNHLCMAEPSRGKKLGSITLTENMASALLFPQQFHFRGDFLQENFPVSPPCSTWTRRLISVIPSIIPSSTFYPDCLCIYSPS